jgi:hypothetical protein
VCRSINSAEERVPLDDLNDLYQYADRLEETVGFYEPPK